jgi:hypothetical protein
MGNFDSPILEAVTVAGSDHAAELEAVEFELRQLPASGLDRAAQRAEQDRLWAEQDRIAALPVVPAETRWMDTGLTYASEWAALDGPERGAWLRSKGIRVHVAKTESGAVQAAWDALNLAAMGAAAMVEGNGVSAVITWLGSGIDWTE